MHQSEGSLEPTRLFGAPSLLITARLDGSRGGRGDGCPARFPRGGAPARATAAVKQQGAGRVAVAVPPVRPGRLRRSRGGSRRVPPGAVAASSGAVRRRPSQAPSQAPFQAKWGARLQAPHDRNSPLQAPHDRNSLSPPAARPRCPRGAGPSPAAPGRPSRCGPGPRRSPRRACRGWPVAPRAGPACVDANSLRRVWRLNFEFRAVARRTSSCTRMLSRSSGPRAVPRPRPAPAPAAGHPAVVAAFGLRTALTYRAARAGGGAARASPGLPQRAIAMGGFGPGRDRRALFTGRTSVDVQPAGRDALRLNPAS